MWMQVIDSTLNCHQKYNVKKKVKKNTFGLNGLNLMCFFILSQIIYLIFVNQF